MQNLARPRGYKTDTTLCEHGWGLVIDVSRTLWTFCVFGNASYAQPADSACRILTDGDGEVDVIGAGVSQETITFYPSKSYKLLYISPHVIYTIIRFVVRFLERKKKPPNQTDRPSVWSRQRMHAVRFHPIKCACRSCLFLVVVGLSLCMAWHGRSIWPRAPLILLN